nr:arginine--tRNA ligase [Alphaproteobacteria bacterium]
MDIYKNFHEQVLATVSAIWPNEPKLMELSHIQVEQPREAKFGDISTNAAMIVGKKLGMSPMVAANLLLSHIAKYPEVAEV